MRAFASFQRQFLTSAEHFSVIGTGEIGGKASGLACIRDLLADIAAAGTENIEVSIPRLTVIATHYFDSFMKQNHLDEIAYSETLSDYLIAHKFQQADLPVMMLGDLRSLIKEVHAPLAIRSSSLLEDAMYEPFAGIYATKMIPNNQPSPDVRFQKLVEAIKFVYASTFFKHAKDYLKTTRHAIEDEKMAIIIQEVVGLRHGDRFYPNISGVARSYNFYPTGRSRPEDGVVYLAMGLGKTIVDGGICWHYSPKYPKLFPPGTTKDLLKQTQLCFWAINMGKPPEYNPLAEAEYLRQQHIMDAAGDRTLPWLVSSYDPQSDRISPGMSGSGPKILTFAPVLALQRLPLNPLIMALLTRCKEAVGADVEIEFALTVDPARHCPPRLGFLQVRPMVVSDEVVEISAHDFSNARLLAVSEHVLGNGSVSTLTDIVYVKPETFDAKDTLRIASEIEQINSQLLREGRRSLLIGFGRWGSADPWLGIPVKWSQINSAKVIVEATLPQMNPDLSQGSHFFHNISSFQVFYLSIKHSGAYSIAWDWLDKQPIIREMPFVRHVRTNSPLHIKIDGRQGKGVILT